MMNNEQQPFIGAVVGGAIAKKVVGKLVEAGMEAAVARVAKKSHTSIQPQQVKELTEEIAQEMAKDPRMVNTTNSEPLSESRIVAGSSMAFLPAFGYLLYAVSVNGTDISEYFRDPVMMVAVPAVWGGGMAFLGRVRKGLGPFKWFGLKK